MNNFLNLIFKLKNKVLFITLDMFLKKWKFAIYDKKHLLVIKNWELFITQNHSFLTYN